MAESDNPAGASWATLTTSLVINGCIALVVLVVFEVLRRCLPEVYTPRHVSGANHEPLSAMDALRESDPTINPALVPPPPKGTWAFWSTVATTRRAVVLAGVGVDAYSVMTLLKLGLVYFATVTCIYGLCVLVPINVVGQRGSGLRNDLDSVSIARLPPGSNWFWAHAVSVYAHSFGLIALLARAWVKHILPVRWAWLAIPHPARTTVLAIDLPPHVVDDASLHSFAEGLFPGAVSNACLVTKISQLEAAHAKREGVVARLEDLRMEADRKRIGAGPGRHGAARPPPADATSHPAAPTAPPGGVWKRRQWWNPCSARIDALADDEARLRRVDAKLLSLRALGNTTLARPARPAGEPQPPPTPTPRQRLASMRPGGKRSDDDARSLRSHVLSRQHSEAHQRLSLLTSSLRKRQRDGNVRPGDFATARTLSRISRTGCYEPSGVGFVSFVDLPAAQTAMQVMSVAPRLAWRTTRLLPAPEPRDVRWSHISLPHNLRSARTRTAILAATALTLFYTIPIGFIASLISLQSLSRLLPGLRSAVEGSPISEGVISGFVPAALLQLFVLLVPLIMHTLAEHAGGRSYTEVAVLTARFIFVFRLWVSLLALTVQGTVFTALERLLNNPASVINVLAASLPKLAGFFISWLLLQSLVSLPLSGLALDRLFCFGCIRRRAYYDYRTTPRERRRVRADLAGEAGYETLVPAVALTFVIGLAYSSINPLISPAALLYFAVAWMVTKYRLMYVSTKRWETGGRFMELATDWLFVGLLIFQLTMLGLFVLKEAAGCAALVAPVPILTAIAWHYVHAWFVVPSRKLPMELARDPRKALSAGGSGGAMAAAAGGKGGNAGGKHHGDDLRLLSAMTSLRMRVVLKLKARAAAARQRVKARRAGDTPKPSSTLRSPVAVTVIASPATPGTTAPMSKQLLASVAITSQAMASAYAHPALLPQFDTPYIYTAGDISPPVNSGAVAAAVADMLHAAAAAAPDGANGKTVAAGPAGDDVGGAADECKGDEGASGAATTGLRTRPFTSAGEASSEDHDSGASSESSAASLPQLPVVDDAAAGPPFGDLAQRRRASVGVTASALAQAVIVRSGTDEVEESPAVRRVGGVTEETGAVGRPDGDDAAAGTTGAPSAATDGEQ